MPSDNVERAKKIIAKYPEVFESLLEFERTKKISKLYRRKRIDITIDENVLRDFKIFCSKNNLNMSRVIEKCMIDNLKKE